jgi:hypothetical protein
MLRASFRHVLLLSALVAISLVVVGCGRIADRLDGGRISIRGLLSAKTATPTPSPTPPPTPTPYPTATPRPSGSGNATSLQATGLVLPSEPNTPFEWRITQDEANAYLAGQTLDESGVTVEDAHVLITPQEVVVDAFVQHAESGVAAGITAHGVPSVHDGQAFVLISQVELDRSLGTFARRIATAMIDQAIKDYSGPYGIAVPADNVIIERIELQDGAIIIAGRTK